MPNCLNDPREESLKCEKGVGYYLEENNREEKMYKCGSKILDLCDLPFSEYMKPMTIITNGSGGTSIDLSEYVTTSALNATLADYVSSGDFATALSAYTPTSNLATVATSGSYNDLNGKPTIPTVPVQDVTVGGTSVLSNGIAVIPAIPDVSGKEDVDNKVTSLSSSSTDAQYPSAKCVYDELEDKQDTISATNKLSADYVEASTDKQFVSSTEKTAWDAKEDTSNKASTLVGNETNTTKYPNTKALADALGKWGVISQTQTWSGSNSTGYTYAMSNQVYGLIPQSNIDLYVAAGATFNDTNSDIPTTDFYGNQITHRSGCFLLNGLGDISYEEMKNIYAYHISKPPQLRGCFQYANIRTNLPDKWYGTLSPNIAFINTSTTTLYMNDMFSYSQIEIALLPPPNNTTNYIHPTNLNNMTRGTSYLKQILNVIDLTNINMPQDVFYQAIGLEEVRIKGLKVSTNICFVHCPNLSVESILFMIENEAATSAITITLHADAYTRAIADTDIQTTLSTHTNISLASV